MFKKSTVFILHFAPSLRFTLSLQSAFYTQSAFYPWSAVSSLRFTLTDKETKITQSPCVFSQRRNLLWPNKNCAPLTQPGFQMVIDTGQVFILCL